MSIAIHLSVYLRYIDSINRPLLQNIIERFNAQGILKHSICIRDGGWMFISIHLSVYLRYIDSINRLLLQYIIELFKVKVIFKHSISIHDCG